MHKNRDYWARPIQSDRMSADYGNNRIAQESLKMSWLTAIIGGAIVVLAVFGLLFLPTN